MSVFLSYAANIKHSIQKPLNTAPYFCVFYPPIILLTNTQGKFDLVPYISSPLFANFKQNIIPMKKNTFIALFLMLLSFSIRAQKADTMRVYYYENYPYAYTEMGSIKGIELEIMDEFIAWMQKKKDLNIILVKRQYTDFNSFYNDVKSAKPGVIGMGSVSNSVDRETDVLFSPPYMKNVSVLICDGNVPSIKIKSAAEINYVFKDMEAFAVKNSSHEKYMNEIKIGFMPGLKINTTETQISVLNKIVNDKKNFGFVDIVAYWTYLKTNSNKYLKIQKVFNAQNEMFGFIMPKNSRYAVLINEFFESGFGFTATKKYRQILENYLGSEIIDDVEIK